MDIPKNREENAIYTKRPRWLHRTNREACNRARHWKHEKCLRIIGIFVERVMSSLRNNEN